ncbi:MAG TPA: ABC transporter permease [Alphaproteobacteria bacterium]|nr:ABC transporter permease [Alphaproteobacteria bacterium]
MFLLSASHPRASGVDRRLALCLDWGMFLARLILIRVATASGVLLAISILLFFAIETLPGDLASETASRFTPEDQIAFAREQLGLNAHPVRRYLAWIGAAARGDFGTSFYSRGDIAPMLAERLGNTALLAGFAAAMAIPAGFVAAVISVIARGGIFDRGMTVVSLAVISMPEFLIAYLLMTVFVVIYPVFPAHTIFYDDMARSSRLAAMVLPAATLAVVGFAPVLRISRASLINVLASGYVETARLKGLPIWRIVLVHALPNALPPIINMVVLLIAHFLVGAFIVEQIFSYPGIGKAMIAAVKFRDIPLVLATGLVFAVFFVTLNLLADVISLLVTPRARTS